MHGPAFGSIQMQWLPIVDTFRALSIYVNPLYSPDLRLQWLLEILLPMSQTGSFLPEGRTIKRGMAKEYIEERDGNYYLAGTRISLDSVVHAFRRRESPETICQNFE